MGSADVRLHRVAYRHKPVLANLVQLYRYDFSEFRDLDLTPHGIYPYAYLDYYFNERDRTAYFVMRGERLAGFVLTHRRDGRSHVGEFFVLRAYRRHGVGRSAALATFATRPGPWSLEVDEANPVARRFWSAIVAEVAAGPADWTVRRPPAVDYASYLVTFTVPERPPDQSSPGESAAGPSV